MREINRSLSSYVKEDIEKIGRGNLITVNDFAKYCNDLTVSKILGRLVDDGVLVRIIPGLFLYPKDTKYGIVTPTLNEIAEGIAKKDQIDILPTGETVLNILGLSEQVPMNAVFITNGSPRKIYIGKRTITFKKGVPRYFKFQNKIFAYIVQAMKALKKESIDNKSLELIYHHLSEIDEETLKNDLKIAPIWMRNLLVNNNSNLSNKYAVDRLRFR